MTKSKELVFYSWIPISPEVSRLSPYTHAQQHTQTSRIFYTFTLITLQCHIQKLTLKIKRNTYLLSNGKQLMDQETKKLVYCAHIASHIQYGLLLWGNNASGDQLDKIQKLQNKC